MEYILWVIGGLALVWVCLAIFVKGDKPTETDRAAVGESENSYRTGGTKANAMLYKATGTTSSRTSRRATARLSRTRHSRPYDLDVPDGMFFDELLGELCYLAEEIAYQNEMAEYDRAESYANYDDDGSLGSGVSSPDPEPEVAQPLEPAFASASAVVAVPYPEPPAAPAPVPYEAPAASSYSDDDDSGGSDYDSGGSDYDSGGGDDGGGDDD